MRASACARRRTAREASFPSFAPANRRRWRHFALYEQKFESYRVFSPRTPRTHSFFILFLAVHSLIIGCFSIRGIVHLDRFERHSPIQHDRSSRVKTSEKIKIFVTLDGENPDAARHGQTSCARGLGFSFAISESGHRCSSCAVLADSAGARVRSV